jgi:hypothetical protein
LDNNKGKLAFQNGIMDLETRVFRYGIEWDDYITDTIHYDYVETSFEFIKSKLLLIMNNNQEHLEYFLSIIGYSFVGDAELEKALYFMIDKTEDGRGNNGKTLFFDVLTHLMPYYVYKSKASFIMKSNTKIHKQLVKMKGKRLAWLEELPKAELNAELIKEIGDGKLYTFDQCKELAGSSGYTSFSVNASQTWNKVSDWVNDNEKSVKSFFEEHLHSYFQYDQLVAEWPEQAQSLVF